MTERVTELDLITVEVVRDEELSADRADLFLTIQGYSLVTGNQALKRAKEVAQLVGALTQQGLPEQDISLEGVAVEMTKGIVKTSQAMYHLRVRCDRLEMLGDALGVIASQKNITLNQIVWGYDDDEERDRWLEECAGRAPEKAKRIAAGLGVKLTGVHSFSEKRLDSESYGTDGLRGGASMQRSRRSVDHDDYDLGLDVSHKKRVTLTVQAEYRVSGYGEREAASG